MFPGAAWTVRSVPVVFAPSEDSRFPFVRIGGQLAGARLRRDVPWFQNGPMNITVKNLPDSVYRVIKREAKRNRRSLNSEIIQTLGTEAAEAERRRQLGDVRKELDRFAASLPPLSDSSLLIRRERER